METYRLKNIAIVILLLLNAFLLLLLGGQYLQAMQTETDTAGQLRALYQSSQLELDSQIDLSQQSLPPLLLSRQSQAEQAIASFLLGGEAVSASQGGGIYSYTAQYGAIHFRAGGSFDGSKLDLPVEDITEFARRFCRQFDYEDVQFQLEGGTGTVTAVQQVTGVPVSGCGLTLHFEEGVLTAAAGSHVSLEDASAGSSGRMDCVTALLRFLDYRSTSGIVCSAVTDVRCVYELQAGSPLRLLPMWQIAADTAVYFVDCASGEVIRR